MADARNKCSSCRLWHTRGDNMQVGECRRHAPMVVIGSKDTPRGAFWPVTDSTDWCGEWRDSRPAPAAATPTAQARRAP